MPALIAAALLLLALLLLLTRVWGEGAAGCARILQNAAYYDESELDRQGASEAEPTPHVFTDAAYDEAFPDLYEPTNSEMEDQ